jgi:transposase
MIWDARQHVGEPGLRITTQNRRHVEVREVMNGIMYILSTGCQWRNPTPTAVLLSVKGHGGIVV